MANDLTTSLRTRGDHASEPRGAAIGSQGPGSELFLVLVAGGDVRRWAADRLGVAEWRRLSPTVQISA
jgi:hypothetical protein